MTTKCVVIKIPDNFSTLKAIDLIIDGDKKEPFDYSIMIRGLEIIDSIH